MARLPWLNTTPLTTAASPLVSPWLQVPDDMTQVLPSFSFAGGTSVHSIEGSWDGSTLDASPPAAYAAPTTGTAFLAQHPFIRWRTVQTVGNATASNVFLRPKV